MRLGFADPPYLGCSWLYPEHPDAARWDDPAAHGELMAQLEAEFDGWAYCLSAKSTFDLLPLVPRVEGLRLCAWVKPFSAFKKHVRVAYGWEPLVVKMARPNGDTTAPESRDWIAQNMERMTGTIGAKPARVCRWILDTMGYVDGDELVDLFPGSGVMGQVIAQGMLPLVAPKEPPPDLGPGLFEADVIATGRVRPSRAAHRRQAARAAAAQDGAPSAVDPQAEARWAACDGADD
jgi:hypothetical protein